MLEFWVALFNVKNDVLGIVAGDAHCFLADSLSLSSKSQLDDTFGDWPL